MKYKDRVRAAYKRQRAINMPAEQALIIAKIKARSRPLEDDRTLPNGWSIRVQTWQDEDMRMPWKEHDGHGVVRYERTEDESCWVLESSRNSYVLYDWRATMPIAIKDAWDAPPYGTGNARQRAMRAMKADYEYCRRFATGYTYWVGFTVTVIDEHGDEIASDSCAGYESDYDMRSEIRASAAHLIRAERAKVREARRAERIARRFNNAMACGV